MMPGFASSTSLIITTTVRVGVYTDPHTLATNQSKFWMAWPSLPPSLHEGDGVRERQERSLQVLTLGVARTKGRQEVSYSSYVLRIMANPELRVGGNQEASGCVVVTLFGGGKCAVL